MNLLYVSGDLVNRTFAEQSAKDAGLDFHSQDHAVPGMDLGQAHAVVIDLDHAVFDQKDDLLDWALTCLDNQFHVGIHTYFVEDPRLDPLRGQAVFANTFDELLPPLRAKHRAAMAQNAA